METIEHQLMHVLATCGHCPSLSRLQKLKDIMTLHIAINFIYTMPSAIISVQHYTLYIYIMNDRLSSCDLHPLQRLPRRCDKDVVIISYLQVSKENAQLVMCNMLRQQRDYGNVKPKTTEATQLSTGDTPLTCSVKPPHFTGCGMFVSRQITSFVGEWILV